jgi:hypothetical protein
MILNATFNNISILSWRSVLLVEETGRPGENHRHVTSNWQTVSHNVVDVKWFLRAKSSSPVFSGVCVTRSLVLCVCFVDHCLSFCTFSFCHCVVCSSSIFEFWLPLCYLQTRLTCIYIAVLLYWRYNIDVS